MSFWPSAALTVFGSVFWELNMETETPSINDLVITGLGGSMVGEMLHRLYVLADSHGSPVIWISSPLDGLNDMIEGRPNRGDSYHELTLYETSFSTGAGYARHSMNEIRGQESSNSAPELFTEGIIVYGNPYGLRSKVPFEQFEQRIRLSFALPYYEVDYFSDGFIWARPFGYSTDYQATLGFSLHYDFIFGPLINFFSNALGVSYKAKWNLSDTWNLSVKVHTNWVVLGGSEYIYVWYDHAPYQDDTLEHRDYDLSAGENLKLYVSIGSPQWGEFLLNAQLYGLHTIPASVPEQGSTGSSIIGIFDLAYERHLFKTWNIGIGSHIYYKRGFYDDVPHVGELTTSYNLYMKRRFGR
jgi:hypothetical protein